MKTQRYTPLIHTFIEQPFVEVPQTDILSSMVLSLKYPSSQSRVSGICEYFYTNRKNPIVHKLQADVFALLGQDKVLSVFESNCDNEKLLRKYKKHLSTQGL